jgi:hypothetical protein
MKKSRLLGALCAILFTLISASTEASIVGQSVTMSYDSAITSSSNNIADTQTSVIGTGVEFIARSPLAPNLDLFEVDFADSTLTITALHTLTDSTFMEFNWDFLINAPSGLVFTEASIISNTLFSIPPFTFAVDPTLTVNSQLLSVNQFMSCGVGTCTVTDGGSLNIAFTVVPVPAAVWLFASGLLGLVGMARRKRSV